MSASPPTAARNIKRDLDGLLSALINAGIVVDQNFPAIRPLGSNRWEVTFDGSEHISFGTIDGEYATLHSELASKRSYTLKFIDEGLLQLGYLFDGQVLVRHRLAYYPSPNLRAFAEDSDSYFEDEMFVDIVSRRMTAFPLRFDFDEKSAKDVIHPKCHLTLGDAKDCRIPVSSPLTPRWFLEFVIRNFYQTKKYDFLSGLPNHVLDLNRTITMNETGLVHIVIPQAAR